MDNNVNVNNTQNPNKKTVLTVSIIGLALLVVGASFFLGKQTNTPISNTWTGTTMSGSVSGTGVVATEKVYLVYNENPVVFSKAVIDGFVELGKKYNQELIPVLSNDEKVSDVVKAMGDKIYYPMFVFSTTSPNIKYSDIPKDAIVEDSKNGLFVMKEPIMLNLPKIVYPRNAEINALLSKYELNVRNVNENTKTYVLAVEDPLCPYCSQSYLDKETISAIGDNGLKHIYYPLPISGHENANALIGLLKTNTQPEILDTIFKNQEAFAKVAETDVKKTLQSILDKNKVKIKLKDGKPYTEAELVETKDVLLKLGVLGTPSYFVVNEKEIILVGSLDMIKDIFKK